MPTQPSYRAWRFVHPDLDVPDTGTGVQLDVRGGVAMVEGPASVRQAIFLLLSTRPGERVMRPDYGCDLYRVVFMNNDDTTAGLAIHWVRVALLRWEPRIEILRLDANRNPESAELLDVTLDYRVKLTQRGDQLRFSVPLTGGTI
jgi:phage baseplate assembly protein W